MSKQKNSLFELSSTSLYVNDPDQYIYSHQQYELPPDMIVNKMSLRITNFFRNEFYNNWFICYFYIFSFFYSFIYLY